MPSFSEEINVAIPRGPFAEPDSPGILFVEGAPGIDELCDEIEGYRYVWTETPKGRGKDVYRVDETRIAAMEYANEELEEGTAPLVPLPATPPASPRRVVLLGRRV